MITFPDPPFVEGYVLDNPVRYTTLAYWENGEWLTVGEFLGFEEAFEYGKKQGYKRFVCKTTLEQHYSKTL